MITARGVEIRVGAQLLLSDLAFHISPGDRIGLVGRNGAGKTTLMKTLAAEERPAAGTILTTGSVGYLPQDPRAADPSITVTARILSARGLDVAIAQLRKAEAAMERASSQPDSAAPGGGAPGSKTSGRDALGGEALERAMAAYARADAQFQAAGGYAAEAEAARLAAGVGLPARALEQPVGELSGGQRRRVELARILFADHDTLLLDEPTNHLDADSVLWLRSFLLGYSGGLVVISHDRELLAGTVNRVFQLDPQRVTIDIFNTGWAKYLEQLDVDARRRARERSTAERKAAVLHAQAAKMQAGANTAVAARNMARRADNLLNGLEPVRRAARVARIRLPEPAPSGRTPLSAAGLTKSYGGLDVLTGVDLAVDRGSRVVILGLNGAGKTTLLRILAGHEQPDGGRVIHGHGLRLGYFAQEHDTLDLAVTVRQNLASVAPRLTDGEVRSVLGSFLFSGDDADKPARVLSGGEKTRLALAGLVHSGANVLLLDEPTNNLDPASRDEVLGAVGGYPGAIVMVTHDEGAIEALRPDRVLLLPDATEDLWTDDYLELVSLA
ncbi:ATPase subunit of ABC transporter with duplicated ATPase domains [Kribbella sp. VKM Ac-2527]|uniref:ATPase subunit of ABC transporter with duplicated ATPase domains n=1 Tax=Kribbella caucasensis TaxID=2512215 RepID=A0A4R6K958_9ACTN|nr:ABC-F family ATP-binding cassette domain-containing protein [Kribbella sp. VKM Ac-2527]TDO46332.1 ATPase subunit of ABC transporter with duplicated ATPase domains [Kribbella sp. VKM Ac-2527]